MDIIKLKSFCKVFELRSFSKAAKELFVSQPTISSHILSLEEELGQKLFDRMGKSVIPTLAGETIYKYAKKILDLLHKAELEAKLLKNQVVGNIKIGGSTIPGCYILPKVISKYCNSYSKVDIQLEIDDSEKVVNKVLKGSLDIGVVGAAYEIEDLFFQRIIDDRLVFVGNSKYLSKINSPMDVINVPWVLREKGSGTRRAVAEGLKNAQIDINELNIKAIVTNTEGLLRLVANEVGITVTSIYAVSTLGESSPLVVKEYPFFHFKRSFYLVYHKGRTIYPALRIFIEFLYKNSKEIEYKMIGNGRFCYD